MTLLKSKLLTTPTISGIGVGGGCLVGSYIATTRDVPTIFRYLTASKSH